MKKIIKSRWLKFSLGISVNALLVSYGLVCHNKRKNFLKDQKISLTEDQKSRNELLSILTRYS